MNIDQYDQTFFLFQVLDFVGCIVAVSPTTKSQSPGRNNYFDVHSPKEKKDVRAMVASGFTMTQKNFNTNKKNTMQPLKIKNLSIVPTGTRFYKYDNRS